MGRGWNHPYATRIITPTSETGVLIVVSPQGNRERFHDLGGGAYAAFPGIFTTLISAGGVYTETLRDQSVWTFDAQGQLIGMRDPQGRELALGYSGTPAHLTRIGDSLTSARALTLTYTDDQIATVSDGTRTVAYTYTGEDLTAAADVMGRTTTYTYDSHLLTGVDNALGQPLERTAYDGTLPASKAISQTLQDGRQLALTYLTSSTIITTTGQDGHVDVQQIFYDADNTLTGILANGEAVAGAAFDTGFNPASMVDGNDHTTRMTSTDAGLPVTQEDALGQQTRMRYDAQNRLISTTNALDITTLLRYDSAGQVISTTTGIATGSPVQATTLYTYSYDVRYPGDHQVLEHSGPDGVTTHYTYTLASQVASVTAGYGTLVADTTHMTTTRSVAAPAPP